MEDSVLLYKVVQAIAFRSLLLLVKALNSLLGHLGRVIN